MEKIKLDEGFAFGLGVFETIAVEQGKPVMVKEHLRRLHEGLNYLDIEVQQGQEQLSERAINEYLASHGEGEHLALKIMVSPQNVVFSLRQNSYTEKDYQRGFRVVTSKINRNESSPMAYLKSLSCADNILAKKRAVQFGYDEAVLLNSRGEISEGAVSNVFFCRAGKLYTPALRCGLLPGIVRDWILSNYPVAECVIRPEEVDQFDEMFITNSLMGIMPVVKYDEKTFNSKETASILQNHYKKYR